MIHSGLFLYLFGVFVVLFSFWVVMKRIRELEGNRNEP